jgi:mannose-1-phosphate guanylyltransferase
MIVVIIAGGSGTRLWPLSTPDYPKHLLNINDSDSSLLQFTYKRATRLAKDVYVVSDHSHISHVRDQLSDLAEESFIVEPARRGTANCIIAALAHISKHHSADEPIAFIHADHYIRDVAGFTYSFRLAERVAENEKRIVLVGVEPDEPSTSFGYIEKGEALANQQALVFNVSSFKEKPDYKTAKTYLKSGNYLWNGGYFLGSLETFLFSMETYAPEMTEHYNDLLSASPDEYENVYLSFESIAIDYALIEKVPNLLVVPASFDWMDLGSYSDLHKAVASDEKGNHIVGKVEIEGVQNSFVRNQEDKPVVVIGLDNVAVINTPNGILVVRKDLSQKVGDVSKRLLEKQ